MNKEYDNYIGLQFKDIEKTNPNIYGNDYLRHELGRLGVGTLIIPNVDSYNIEQGTFFAHPTYGTDQMYLGERQEFAIQKGSLDAVRSRIVTPIDLESKVPVFNGSKLRSMGASKWSQYEIASEFMPRTISIESDEIPRVEMLDKLLGNLFVVKADMSQASKHLVVCVRNEVSNAIYGMRAELDRIEKETGKKRKNKRIIIQEFVPGLSWSELHGVDQKNQDILNNAETTELRVYCFVDRDKKVDFSKRHYAKARAFNKNSDLWASVNQEEVPLQAWQIADIVSDRLLASANVPGGYFSIDLIKGDVVDGRGEHIFIREINTRDPMMVEFMDNINDASVQRQLLANVMATVSKSS